jgi:hypothetical protein
MNANSILAQQFEFVQGVETMLFITCGTTDIPLTGVSFATDGVQSFLPGVLKTDPQDFLGKMEGFAVQGVQGNFYNPSF